MLKLATLLLVLAAACQRSASPVAQPTGPMAGATSPVDPTTMEPTALPEGAPPRGPVGPRTPPPSATPPIVPTIATCVEATDVVEVATTTTKGLSLCMQGTPHSCWSVDAGTGTWTPQSEMTVADISDNLLGTARATIDGNTVQVCGSTGTGCQTVPIPGLAPDAGAAAAASSDRELVVVYSQTSMRVFGVQSGRLLSTIKSWKTPMGNPASFQRAHFIGGSLPGSHPVLEVLVSSSPVSSQGKLIEPRTGRVIGALGTPDKNGVRDLDERRPLNWGNNEWVFPEWPTRRLFIQEPLTGKLLKTFELFDDADRKLAGDVVSQQLSLYARTRDGKSFVAVPDTLGAWPVVMFDIATGKRTALRPPRCVH